MNRDALIARLAALGAVVFWGVSFVATKAALREVSPITLVTTRFGLGAVVLLLIQAARRERPAPPRDAWWMLTWMGFVGVFVHQMLQVHGLALTTAVRTGWLIGLIPIWSALLSAAVLRERFGAQKVAGLLVGMLGAGLLLMRGRPSWRVLSLPSTRGDLLILASTVNWAVYTIMGHGTLKRLGSTRATAASISIGWMMFLPFFVGARGWRDYADLSGAGIVAILFLGIGCSGLAYLFWYAALQRIEASRVAAFLYLEPLVTLAAAVALLGEPVSATVTIGGLLVLLGVLIVQRAPQGAPRT